MLKSNERPPTWSKVEPDGSRFLTYDSDLTPIQLQTLDKLVKNLESSYNQQGEAAAAAKRRTMPERDQPSSNSSSIKSQSMANINDNQHIYMKHNDTNGI